MAGQVRAAVDAAVGAVRRREVRLERLDGSARRRGGAPCRVSVSHECRLPEHNASPNQLATVFGLANRGVGCWGSQDRDKSIVVEVVALAVVVCLEFSP